MKLKPFGTVWMPLIVLPLWFFKNAVVAFKTVDLSIFLPPVETIELSSLTRRLNWSLRFFSLKFRDFLTNIPS